MNTSARLIDHGLVDTIKLNPENADLWRPRVKRRRRREDEPVVISRRRYRRLLLMQGLLLFVLLGLLPGLVLAKPAPLPDDIGAGSFFIQSARGEWREALRMESDVHFDISGLVARTRVQQHFKNDGTDWMEGVYVFPLPDNAAVDRLRIKVGERVIEGEIKEREQAKKIYRQAKADGKRTALVEQERPNMFTTSVANIGPHETVIVIIEYQQTLAYRDGRFSLRFPMTVTPRYIPGQTIDGEGQSLKVTGSGWAANTDQVPDASRVTPPVVDRGAELRHPISISASLDAGFPLAHIDSLYHDIRIDRQQRLYQIALQQKVAMDRDFELVWQAAVGAQPNAAFFKQTLNGEDFGLIMILPPQADQALRAQQQSLPRELVFVIDTSGSMAGASMPQAKQALLMALDTLTPADRFNIIEFNSKTRQLFSQAVFADAQSIDSARQFVRNLRADGGTEMAPALRAALDGGGLEGYVRQVVFITDGSVGNETALFKLIEDHVQDSRLFTIGIGSAPNGFFMRRAARFGRGTYTFIGDQDEIASRMQALFERLQSPVLSGLALKWDGQASPEVWPERLPDLYKSEPLLITVRLDGDPKTLALTGEVLGRPWRKTLDLQSSRPREGVAALWARNKIAGLMDRQTSNGDSEDIRKQVTDIALRHRLVSRYTSLVAVDPMPVRARQDELHKTSVANNLPAGSRQNVRGLGFPRGATDSRMHLLFGLLAMLSAAVLFFNRRCYEK